MTTELIKSSPADLSIIIVNFNSIELITECIDSICKHNSNLSLEIIVVDNSGDAEGIKRLRAVFPFIKCIDMGYNAGFARANNAGLKSAEGEIILLLNPDTISVDNSIELCFERLKKLNFSAAGVQLTNEEGQPQISGNFFVKGGLNHLLPIPYWGDFIRWIGYSLNQKVPNVRESKPIEEVDWISGAFLMVKRHAVEKAGLLDEDFFLYAEEVEWCSRLIKTGKLCIFGDLKIIHIEGATVNKNQGTEEKGYYNLYDTKGFQLMVSNHLRVRKQYGSGWFLILLLNYTWGCMLAFCSSFIHGLLSFKNPVGEWPKLFGFFKNVLKLWLLSPIIIRNKPYFYKMLK
jgi:GT2 family glycosyltransferase